MRFAILVFPGSSCDIDAHHAVTNILGEKAELIWHTEVENLEQYDAVIVPHGAAYGDYLRPGALVKGSKALDDLRDFAKTGKPVVGVGNGFQILAEANLLPGAFLQNKGLKFRSGNVKLVVQNIETVFTSAYEKEAEITLPFAHQYGNYYVDEETLTKLKADNRIVFTYKDENIDGSTGCIAGVLNERGNVLGIMPLPERAVEEIIGGTDGLALFKSILQEWSEKNVNNA